MARPRKPPSAWEREVLDVVLVELRRAMRIRGQLTVIIDPWIPVAGTTVFASPNTDGRTYEIPDRTANRRRNHGVRRR